MVHMEEYPAYSQDKEMLLQELAVRLSVAPGNRRTPETQLLPGQLPNDLPFDLPLPPDSFILGSLLRNAKQAEIVLDTSLSPESVLAFYENQLLAAGWSRPLSRMGSQVGGFVASGEAASRLFCQGPRGPSLTVTVAEERVGPTDVRLSIDRNTSTSPCARPIFSGIVSLNLLPFLQPPQGAQQTTEDGRGGSDNATSSAIVEVATDTSTFALSTHYAVLLEQAGWMRLEGGDNRSVAWHTWSLQDKDQEPWHGLFFLLKLPDEERKYYLRVSINHISESSGGSEKNGVAT